MVAVRRPQRAKGGRSQISSVQTIPSPIGGWNTRDSLAAMPPQDARILDNWFPTTTDCELRGGYAAHATTITGTVKTLAVYNAMSGTNKMFASDTNDIWDVTSAGIATAQTTTVTDGKWQWINFGDGTNNYLIMVNGVDNPLYYNGSTWTVITGATSPALSGVTLNTLINVNEYKGRLIFIEKDSLSFWYLGAGVAGGALTEFDLSSFCKQGGYLMWSATWSFDSGDGPDDAIVFMTSEGEVIVYRGTDPSTASDWVLTGVYQIGKPLGRRSFIKYEGDLIVLTQNGIYPLTSALQSEDKRAALSGKIERSFNDSARDYGSNFGWDITYLPTQSAMIFNIPVAENGIHYQYVMNTISKSWCRFKEWDGECFVEFNNELYFGAANVVEKAWTGRSDKGSEIVGTGKQAFNYFGNFSQIKRFNLFRPLMRVNGNLSFLTGFDVDYEDNEITGLSVFTVPSAALWDVAMWDVGYWSSGLETVRDWTSPGNNVGYCVSGGLKVNTDALEIHWIASDYVFETGGVM